MAIQLLMGDNRATSPPPEPSNAWAAQSESSSFYSPSTAYSGSDYVGSGVAGLHVLTLQFYECESHVSSSSIAAPIEDTANATAVPTITPIIISSSCLLVDVVSIEINYEFYGLLMFYCNTLIYHTSVHVLAINAPSFPLTGSDFASFRGIFNGKFNVVWVFSFS